MNEHIWDNFITFLMKIGMPILCMYFSICSNVFLNVAPEDAQGLEKASNYALAPFQYLFAPYLFPHSLGRQRPESSTST